MRALLQGIIGGLILALGIVAIIWPSLALSDGIPHAAHQYRADLTRQARLVWGLDAPIAIMAAQIHQESAWNRYAKSPAGAEGLAQFMPATREWMQEIDVQLTGADAYNPIWALRALARYDRFLLARVSAHDTCNQWAMALAAYNGGLTWVKRDTRLAASQGADPSRWFDHIEHYNAGRSAANFRENRHYPRRILLTLTPRYANAGWGREVCL